MKGVGANLARFIVLCLLGLVMSIPFAWMVCASFKTRAEVDDIKEVRIVPKQPTGRNYPVLLDRQPIEKGGSRYLGLKFGRWYYNNLLLAVCVTVLVTLTSSMAAYAFSRMHWRGRDKVFLLYLATMMIPGIVMMIPMFQIMVSLDFRNTYHGMIVVQAFSAFGTFLLRQFMLSIPSALDEAARVDGANHWRIFWDVIMPLSRPGLLALATITFLAASQSFMWPLVMVDNENLFPMSVGLLSLDSTYGRQTELIMAAAVLNIVPLIMVFVVCQKFLVKGLQLGAVKG